MTPNPPSVSPASCVILVPAGGAIDGGCDDGLRELERRGYPVWRVRGYSAVDAARNQMATDALARGFDEIMWIDSDIVFNPDDVERLRNHNLPVTCGIYPKKGPRQLACEFLPHTTSVQFGRIGGLLEIRYCGFGFTHTRREVYEVVTGRLGLPVCNRRFGAALVPFFAPMVIAESGGAWAISGITRSANAHGAAGFRSSRTLPSVCGTSARTATAGRTVAVPKNDSRTTPSCCPKANRENPPSPPSHRRAPRTRPPRSQPTEPLPVRPSRPAPSRQCGLRYKIPTIGLSFVQGERLHLIDLRLTFQHIQK
jgi:hypothetical protein